MTSRLDKSGAVEDAFAGDFAKLKTSVIKPAFEALSDWLKARGNEVDIAEEPGGNISMHIVPAGVDKSTRPYDEFPVFSVLGSSFTNTVGLQGRNARPDSAAGSGSRSVHALAKISNVVVEAELMKFVDEIGRWPIETPPK
jgi:hypothetical protein